MIGILDAVKIGSGAILGAALAVAPAYLIGKRDGARAERVARLEADVRAYEARKGIDHDVDGLDRYRVCLDLGGLPDDCGRLRGVDEAAAGE